MKTRFLAVTMLTAALSISIVAADGNMSSPGKSCPPNTTCLTNTTELPPVEVNSKIEVKTEVNDIDIPWFQKVFDYLF